jgi:hypothetical protein
MTRWFGSRAKQRKQHDEVLSAYLDGQLSAQEQVHLEAQLAADPLLRAELEALRRTVALVRDLPPVPIPRNFILPQTATARPRPIPSRPRRAQAAPLLTAATSVVSLLFVIVLVGDLLLSGLVFAPAAAPGEVPQVALAPSPVSEAVEIEDVTPTEATLEVPLEVTTEDAEGYAEAQPQAEHPPAAMGGERSEESTVPTPPPGPTEAAEATAVPAAPLTAEEEKAEAAEDEQRASEGWRLGLAQTTLWRVLEISLGLTALGLALATIMAWRARRR